MNTKLTLALILWLLGFFLLISSLFLFDIFYPEIGSPDFWIERGIALKRISVIRMSSVFMIFLAFGLYIWALMDIK